MIGVVVAAAVAVVVVVVIVIAAAAVARKLASEYLCVSPLTYHLLWGLPQGAHAVERAQWVFPLHTAGNTVAMHRNHLNFIPRGGVAITSRM